MSISLPFRNIKHPEVRIRIYPTETATTNAAADYIATLVLQKPDAAVTYATGNTQVPVFENLYSSFGKTKQVDFSQTYAFQLDEYYPADPHSDDFSFVAFLRTHLGKLRINKFYEINGKSSDPEAEAKRYDELLKKHKINLTIMGIGPGGHIAFNEPGTSFTLRTHVAKLSADTMKRDYNRGNHNPDTAITQGIANILESEQLLQIGYGESKGTIFQKSLFGPISPECPSTALRLHPGHRVTIMMDEAAASSLQ